LQETLDTGFHVVVIHQFTAVGLFDTVTDGSAIVSVSFYQSQSGLLHPLFGAGATAASDSEAALPARV